MPRYAHAAREPGGFSERRGLDVYTSVGLSTSDVRAICAGTVSARSADRERELQRLVELLLSVYTNEGVAVWIFSPNPLLDGVPPLVALKEGRISEVARVAALFAHG